MKYISTLAFVVLLTLFNITPSNAIGYLTPTISEYDMVGCKTHSHDPRCKQVIKVGCNSICVGRENEASDLGRACNELCHKIQLKKDQEATDKENEPKTRLQ